MSVIFLYFGLIFLVAIISSIINIAIGSALIAMIILLWRQWFDKEKEPFKFKCLYLKTAKYLLIVHVAFALLGILFYLMTMMTQTTY